jgi:hypothetical protein
MVMRDSSQTVARNGAEAVADGVVLDVPPQPSVPVEHGAPAALLGELDDPGGVVVADVAVRRSQLLVGERFIPVTVLLQHRKAALGGLVRGQYGVGEIAEIHPVRQHLRFRGQDFYLRSPQVHGALDAVAPRAARVHR